ncbi:hypothetical protein ACFLX1_00765 [Chloroflexota bacterium]
MTDDYAALQADAYHLAQQLFGNKPKKSDGLAKRLLDICTRAQGKDFLLIHNPGGWGSTPLERCLEWERSIVEGVSATMEQLGFTWLLTQYFRSGSSWWAHVWDLKDQTGFLFKSKTYKVEVMAAELKFMVEHINNCKVILIGISQGAAFSNAVMRRLGELHQVYSIELGIFFPHMSRRVITERTLAVDSNGVMPDPIAHRNLKAAAKAYMLASFRWIKYCLQGTPEKFANCIQTPGHEYSWDYPEVRQRIGNFLDTNFGTKSNLERLS